MAFFIALLCQVAKAQGSSYTCDARLYQLRQPTAATGSNLYLLDRRALGTGGTAQWTGLSSVTLNALAYNKGDGFFYAVNVNSMASGAPYRLYRLGMTGALEVASLTTIPNLSTVAAGTVDKNGLMYIKLLQSDTKIYTVQLPTTSGGAIGAQGTITLNASIPMADMAFDPVTKRIYGVYTANTPASDGASVAGVVYDIDPSSGTVVTKGAAPALSGTNAIGSSFFDVAGTLYAYQNGGVFGTIDLTTGNFKRITAASAASQSDGASCVFPDEVINVVKASGSVEAVSSTVYKVPYTVTVQNTGSIPDRNVQITENLAQTFSAGNPTLSIVAGPTVTSGTATANTAFDGTNDFQLLSGTNTLAVGASVTVGFTVQVTYPNLASVPTAATSNIVQASSTFTGPNAGYTFPGGTPLPPVDLLATQTSVPAPVTIVGQVDLAITKTGPATAVAGTSISYLLKLSNSGPSSANGATFSDTVPSALTGVTATCQNASTGVSGCVTAIGAGNALTGNIATLPSGGSIEILVTGLVSPAATGSLANTATVSAPAGTSDSNVANNTSATVTTVLTQTADLAITKTDNLTSILTGTSTTYTIRVTNNGPSSVTGAIVKDPNATGLTQTAAACTAASGNTCSTAPTTAALQGTGVTLPTLASGAFYEFTVTATAVAASGTVTNVATVATPSGVNDPATGNNTASDADTVSPIFTVSGQVYEDFNYGGGAGRAYNVGQGMSLRPSVRVELYTSAGVYIAPAFTDASGAYTFPGQLPGSYKVRVVNGFVTSSRTGGCAVAVNITTLPAGCTQLPVQTYIYGASQIGGAAPAGSDPTLSTTTLPATAESVANVTLGTTNIAGVDFGFNFDTIVNTNDSGQGSLRQFVTNSNALLGNSSLLQVGQTPSKETSIFMVPTAALTSGVAIINLTSSFTVTDSDTSIDATTQTANTTTSTGDTNTGALGTGGGVGVDNLPLSQVSKPEVEITLSGANTLQVSAANFTLRGVALHGGSELTLGNGSNAADNVLIEKNIFGTSASSFTLPASLPSAQYGIYIVNGSGMVQNNLIGYSGNSGINYLGGSTGLTIQNNEFQQSGYVQAGGDAITLTGSSSAKSLTITGNLIATSNSSGIQLEIGSVANNTVTNNTITSNGKGGAATRLEGSGIHYLARNSGVNSTTSDTISKNVISNNQESGIVINFGQKNVTISQNSFYTNGLTSIDFTTADGYVGGNANYGQGNGVTPNDGTTVAREGNTGQDYPVFAGIYTNGTALNVSGFVGNGISNNFDGKTATIELYKADDDGNQKGAVIVGDGKSLPHGEGRTYLGTLTVTLGTKGAFSGVVTVTAGALSGGAALTATATIAGNTSEFSPNITQQAPAITLLKLGRNVTTNTTFINNNGSVLVKPKEVVEYCIVYSNTGGQAPNFKLTDNVPAGMVIVPDSYSTGNGVRASATSAAVGGAAAPAGTDLTNTSDADAGTLLGTGNGTNSTGLLTLDLGATGLAAGGSGSVCFQARVP